MKKFLRFVIIFLLAGTTAFSQVSFNTDGTAPDNSAMLDVKSTDKGILLPRMTLAQRNAIASPATGLMIYQTNNTPGFYYNSGIPVSPVWVMTGTGSGWGLTGNNGTSAGTNFIGTTDDVPLVFKVNNQQAGRIDITGGNTSLGYQSLTSIGGGINCTAIGSNALSENTTGHDNCATGYHALNQNTTGFDNTAYGGNALENNVEGYNNTAIGSRALLSNTTGVQNTGSGFSALQANTTGYDNTATGVQALTMNTTGYYNTANGSMALYHNTTGVRNTASGYYSLNSNSTGYNNAAYGTYTMKANTTGYDNTASGANALYLNTTGLENTAIGSSALYYNTGNDNTATGAFSLLLNTTGYNNTASGSFSLKLNTTGVQNTASGFEALRNNTTGFDNTAVGVYALSANTTGYANTAFGLDALKANVQGVQNTACGYGAGSANNNNNNCSFFGYDADQVGITDFTNATAIGFTSRITGDNQVRIGSSTVTSIGGYAGWSNISDGRYKKDVKENVPGLAFINRLKPVTYHLDVTGIRNFLGEEVTGEEGEEVSREVTPEQKAIIDQGVKEKEQINYSGFIAQEVEKAASDLGFDFSGVDKPKNENSLYGLRYAEFVVPLVKAVQELNVAHETDIAAINELKQEIASLKALVEKLSKVENRENK